MLVFAMNDLFLKADIGDHIIKSQDMKQFLSVFRQARNGWLER